ncbi:MAG: TonB C-terminal domain-containing protein [Methylophilaceae bacterium]|nr:TonB C-terminal domain-containing protein [Methylophilaceae bacterium]
MQQTANINLDEEDEPELTPREIWTRRIVTALVVILVLALLGYGLKSLFSGSAPHKKAITTIKLLPDTPPPPPPPPPKEQPKEQQPPKEVKVEPQPKPEQAPPAEQLKMEGAAGEGASPFAAGTVNSEYKGGEVGTKIGGGGSHQFDRFAGLLKSRIEDALAKDPQLASGKYRLVVHVWVKPNGRIERLDLIGSSGDVAKDELIKTALSDIPALSEMPPEGLPQPIKLRITARSSG